MKLTHHNPGKYHLAPIRFLVKIYRFKGGIEQEHGALSIKHKTLICILDLNQPSTKKTSTTAIPVFLIRTCV